MRLIHFDVQQRLKQLYSIKKKKLYSNTVNQTSGYRFSGRTAIFAAVSESS